MTDLIIVIVLLVAAGSARWLLWDQRAVPLRSEPRGHVPSVSIVIPARNEETTLPSLLESLHELTVDVADIIVVDDGSHDSTASIARSAGARVLTATAPPPGWTGKAWACHLGSRASNGDLLLFLDADTVLAPDALAGLLELHEQHGGLISVQPFHQVVRPYEQLSSYFNAVSLLASAVFARRPGKRPMAFGPCLLTSREDYELVGGHAAVRGEILDDVQLAAAYQRVGLPVRGALGDDSIQMRSYPDGVRQMADGWTKNFAAGATAAASGPALASALWVCAHHAVAVGAALGLIEIVTGRGAALTYGHPALWAVAWVGVTWQLRSILRTIGSFRWWTWLLFPVPLLAFDILFARSAALTAVRRSVRWRGRTVDLAKRSPAEKGA